ncbi:hypothetical protein JQC72_15265 [Polycladomyces sp. WAk]|uniref:Uncharacterized protein n=1 Tax=Polycladomyces zharkentensis TaxID=2807616 RepID=A0ABS2WMU5_9BACL|nr:hypothetical protein [Polycladomyces sp. WAk]MBN2910858.1 hypothetical protein [Polycladomyces sp. WAk]
MKSFKLVASWIFVIISVIGLLIGFYIMGLPFVMALLIGPILVSVFSTDSPFTPEYVPYLIFFGGYALEIGWFALLSFALKNIVLSFKKDEQDSQT